MNRYRWKSLQFRLILLGTLSVAIALVTACLGFVWTDLRALQQAKRQQLQAQAEIVGFNSAAVLLIGDAQAGEQLLAPLSIQPTIDAAGLYSEDGRLLASYAASGAAPVPRQAPVASGHTKNAAGELVYVQDVVEGGQRVGKFYLRANMQDLFQQMREHVLVSLVVVAASLAAALPLAFALARAISRPILELAHTADHITRHGDFSVRVASRADNEIGTLYRAFNALLVHVDASDRALKASQDELEQRVELRTAELQQEIHERERVQQDLIVAKDAAEAASRAKSDFLANMSHEIRTPMNGVLGLTELVLETDLSREQRESMEMVKSSAEALMIVINDILDFSKIEAGKLELDPIEFELRDLIEETVKSLAHRAHRQGLELICDLGSTVPERVVGDAGRLRQVLINLVGNALKFTHHGEIIVQVQVDEAAHDDLAIRFAVTDTGIGIPHEKQELIFAAFSQADTSTTRKYGGTGLGLTISSRLVNLMGGLLRVESTVGQGSTFFFTVTFQQPREDALPRATTTTALGLAGVSVLVVDDNATNRRILEGTLRNFGARPTVAESGPAALAELRRAAAAGEKYALLLIDAMMPDMDGFMLIEQLRQLPDFGRSLVMMLSSADSMGDAERCRRLGVASYLVKPIRSDDLRRAIVASLMASPPTPRAASAAPQSALPPCPSATTLRPLKILLAEDNPVNQRVAVSILSKRGHAVAVAGNEKEALAALARESFDVVLMDIQMPELDGLEATRAIRAEELEIGRHLPIIAMTAHAMKGDRERCLQGGMDDYVSKPVDAKQLAAALERVMAQSAPAAADAPTTAATTAVRDDEAPGSALPRATPAAAVPPSDVLDLAALREHIEDDDELLRELIDLFLENMPSQMTAIETAVSLRDAAAIERAAHALKGALRSLCAVRSGQAAQNLELAGRAGDITGVVGLLGNLRLELGLLQSALADVAQETAA